MAIWSDRELGLLLISHKMGASLRLSARLVDRSESAANKALMRYGIRQLGVRKPGIKKQGPHKKPLPTFLEGFCVFPRNAECINFLHRHLMMW
ncbi:MAG: hypothetical protein GY915_08640 [bacterium]|nr:hypothetical protein [bacterium]